ncbi:MAG: amino acid racemase [Oscillospiraceae bacterium]|nr:amino acid racemase [Oscillospiraceae bacterium]
MIQDFLGVVGGLGPMATAHFMKRIIEFTDANTDQEHIKMMILNATQIPDRTKFILGKSDEDPFDELLDCCKTLEAARAKLIAIPCNAAHYFYDKLAAEISVPIVHMQRETVKELKSLNVRRIGIAATTGTICAGLFQNALKKVGLNYLVPDDEHQNKIMKVIYDDIKAGRETAKKELLKSMDWFFESGCDRIVLGCTELSVLKSTFSLDARFVDALDVTAKFVVRYFDKKIKEC